jgi:prevent-host-death family protein
MTYPLTAAQAKLAELVAEARRSHRPVTISEHGRPVAALINVDDLADLEDRAALAAHLADKAAGRSGTRICSHGRVVPSARWPVSHIRTVRSPGVPPATVIHDHPSFSFSRLS